MRLGSVTYVLMEVHAILFLLSLRVVDHLLFFLVLDALDKIGKRGRSGMHLFLIGGFHFALALYLLLRALSHRLSVRGQPLIMRCKSLPVRLNQNRIIRSLIFSPVVKAERLAAEGRDSWLGSHLDEGALLVLLLLDVTIFEDLLPGLR